MSCNPCIGLLTQGHWHRRGEDKEAHCGCPHCPGGWWQNSTSKCRKCCCCCRRKNCSSRFSWAAHCFCLGLWTNPCLKPQVPKGSQVHIWNSLDFQKVFLEMGKDLSAKVRSLKNKLLQLILKLWIWSSWPEVLHFRFMVVNDTGSVWSCMHDICFIFQD